MTTEYTDLTESKRPQQVPDQTELAKVHLEIDQISIAIRQREQLEDELQLDPNYPKAVRTSIARAHQLSRRMLDKPLNVDTLMWHADVRGRLAERWEMIEERLGLRHCIDKLEQKKTWKQKMITPILDGIEKVKRKKERR